MRDHLVGIGPAIAGLVIVIALILAVVYGKRRRAREPAPPPPESQPKAPKDPTGYETGRREAAEVPHEGERLLPHELKDHGNSASRPGDPDKEQSPWQEGHSGSFGNG
ncbi:hypothetical protein KGS77_21185 [Streptomyces sp. MST-110588]|nr:hypothetical protein KGS77_21185 [Streptomyces sp. MST-110588]